MNQPPVKAHVGAVTPIGGSAELRAEASTHYGDVPSDWNVARFKRIATIRNGRWIPRTTATRTYRFSPPTTLRRRRGVFLHRVS